MEDLKEIKLSKSILDMKFMKRTKERVLKEKEDAEGNAMYSSEITEQMKKSGNLIFNETSIFNCKGLIDGRLSFGGFNPEIETLMKEDRNMIEAEKRKETDISDLEMAKEYSTVVTTISNKFKNKRRRKNSYNNSSNKNKFMKPADD